MLYLNLSAYLFTIILGIHLFQTVFCVNSESKKWQIYMSEGISFVHFQDDYNRQFYKIDEQKQIPNILQNYSLGNLFEFIEELHSKMPSVNQKLMAAKEVADKEKLEMYKKYSKNEIKSQQLDHPFHKYETITMILRAQNMTIGRHFLAKFLSPDTENQQNIGKISQKLQMHEKVLDIVRYEEKLQHFNDVLESIKILLVEKFEYMRSRCSDKKFETLNFQYTYEDYTNSLQFIENKLKDVHISYDKSISYWTIDNRPKVVQTLYVVRHAQREDNVDKDWCKNLEPTMSKQDVPLSNRGKNEQAKELGKWFKTIPIDQIYTSPFQRCVATATGILSAKNDSIFLNIEPGLTEFFKPCEQRMKFMESTKLYEMFKLSNPNYWPSYNKWALELGIIGRSEVKDPEKLENSCHFVLENTIRHILESNKKAKNIVLVSHSGTIGIIHQLLTNEWAGVGQATVSKFVQYADTGDDDTARDVLKRFRLEYSSAISHLSQHHYLRPH